MTTDKLSLLIVARNEERRIEDCIVSGKSADEIVIVLDRSDDATAEIAARLGAKILSGSWPDEGARRMAGINACSGGWILELDADERVSASLAAEIKSAIHADEADYYVIPFRNYIGDKFVEHGWGAYNGVAAKASLFRRGMKQWLGGTVHPAIKLEGRRGRLNNHIDHFVDADLTAMYERLNRYSSAASTDAVAQGSIPRRSATLRRFFSRFLKSYWQRKGYRQGWRGVALALFSGLYPVLTHLKILERMEETAESNPSGNPSDRA